MVRPKKKGTSGQAKNFITRTQAVRKLQVSLPDFRRLCIFKGIYPRQPRSRRKAAKNSTPTTTFYYTKDIQYLLHEPLLNKFRAHNALAKKIARALGKAEYKDAARLERTQAPRMTLDHIVKERYPTFQDALRDLDDALSMLFLFANLPSHMNIPSKTIRLCQRLCHEFQHYLIITHSLRKSFLSIKGIYYQAIIQGQEILWLVPYNFVQRVTGDVDFRIMSTFVEFYTTLLGFVNYRLYTTAGFVYPPKFNAGSDDQGGDLDAFMLQARQISAQKSGTAPNDTKRSQTDESVTLRAQAIADTVALKSQTPGEQQDDLSLNENNDDEDIDDDEGLEDAGAKSQFRRQSPSADDVELPSVSSSEVSQKAAGLFKPFVFFLSRETPRAPLEFLLKAFGCTKVGWNEISGAGAFTHDERDKRITHQVVDRPPVPILNGNHEETKNRGGSYSTRMPGRVYVQPQWIWDCVNACELLRTDLYAPGATLPPHLSPFVKPKPGEYDPNKPLEEVSGDEADAEELQNDERVTKSDKIITHDDEESLESEDNSPMDKDSMNTNNYEGNIGDFRGLVESEEDDALGSEAEGEPHGNVIGGDVEDDFAGFSDNGAVSDEDEYEQELKAEITGKPVVSSQSMVEKQKQANKAKSQRQREKEAEHKERQKMMLSRKKRTLYEKMEFGNAQRNAEAERLQAKRRKIERSRG